MQPLRTALKEYISIYNLEGNVKPKNKHKGDALVSAIIERVNTIKVELH